MVYKTKKDELISYEKKPTGLLRTLALPLIFVGGLGVIGVSSVGFLTLVNKIIESDKEEQEEHLGIWKNLENGKYTTMGELYKNSEEYEGKFVRTFGQYDSHNFFESKKEDETGQFQLYLNDGINQEGLIMASHNHQFGERCKQNTELNELKEKGLLQEREIEIKGVFHKAKENLNPKGFPRKDGIFGMVIQTDDQGWGNSIEKK